MAELRRPCKGRIWAGSKFFSKLALFFIRRFSILFFSILCLAILCLAHISRLHVRPL